jgi:3-oxoacyl-[acyl-carrier-protein] synthase-1
MKLPLECLYTASALGRGNDDTLSNLLARKAPGMAEISGDIPGRSVWFGSVPGDIPNVADGCGNLRANRLLGLAVDGARGAFAALVEKYGADRVGIVLGASNTGVDEAERHVDTWLDRGEKPAEFDFSALELGTPAAYLKSVLGTKGPSYVISTACSSSAKAFGAARRLIERGICDAVVTGGVDGRCRFALNGFHALGALSEGRCRPLAPDRDGINLGEGVALFAMARERADAKVFLAGVGESSDAYHATAPDPEGLGAEASMRAAISDAGLSPADVDYVNLHGTGTRANDDMEMKAFGRVFGGAANAPRYESTKSLTGHCLGAAGAVEAALCCLLVGAGRCRTALSNSFAFGGSNASVVISA